MRRHHCRSLLPAAALILASAAAASAMGDSADPAAAAARHGGTITATPGHAFETVLAADGVRLYLLTDEFAPAMVDKAAGTAQLKLPDGRQLQVPLVKQEPAAGEPATYFCPMHAQVIQDKPGSCDLCGGMTLFAQDALFGAADLSGVDLGSVQVMVRVSGLRGSPKEATFSPAFPTPDAKAVTKGSGR